MSQEYTVIKHFEGKEVFQYFGVCIAKSATMICIEAEFSFPPYEAEHITLRKGDMFTEWYFSDRWYNVYRIEDGTTRELKGWYCNIATPAKFTENTISYNDLALDVFIYPNGDILLLDEDEFVEMTLTQDEENKAHQAVEEIRHLSTQRLDIFAKW